MNSMHLFAGGGGGLLGDLILGHKPIVAVEWDKNACAVLRERVSDGWFPDMQVFEGDVRLFDPSEFAGRVDCIHAGFPCQDISVAGKQAGVGEGTRSGLYREVLRIADVVRPDYLFMENVSAILYNGLGTVLGDLSTRGYSARWICIRASDVGANHGRDRWWLLAKRGDISPYTKHNWDGWRKQQQTGAEKSAELADTICIRWNTRRGNDGKHDRSISASDGQHGREVSDTNGERLQGQRSITVRTKAQHCKYGHDSYGKNQSELGGMADGVAAELDAPTWWQVEPDIGRATTDSTGRIAGLKMLGNGQVPLQMAVAFSILDKLFY